MNASPRVLLVEHLDALGAAAADLTWRTRALRSAGCTVRPFLLEVPDPLRLDTDPTPAPGARATSDDAGLRTLREAAREIAAELVIWASAAPGGGRAARALPPRTTARWWPTGWLDASALRGGPLAPLADDAGGFEWAAADPSCFARPRLSLWDGPYTLALGDFEGRSGRAALDAWANVSRGRDELDLVVLAHASDASLAMIAELGVDLHVHFVGPAPREAEIAWLQSASAALATGGAPFTAALAWRALACGCPLLPAGDAAQPLSAWLGANGLGVRGTLAEALERTLSPDPDLNDLIERGRTMARGATVEALSERVAAALRGARGAWRTAA